MHYSKFHPEKTDLYPKVPLYTDNRAKFPKYSPLEKGAEGVVFWFLLSFLLLKEGTVPA